MPVSRRAHPPFSWSQLWSGGNVIQTLAMSSSRRRLVAMEFGRKMTRAQRGALDSTAITCLPIRRRLRRCKPECIGIELRVAFDLAERQLRGLSEAIRQQHRLRQAIAKADFDALERRVLRARLGDDPFEAVARTRVADSNSFSNRWTEQDRRRARRQRRLQLFDRHLVQILVE